MTEKQLIKEREKELKLQKKIASEKVRLLAMSEYENEYCMLNVCGIDEAGRGPLAGPVCAAAVILEKDSFYMYLNDSKKVTPKRREVLFDEIKEKATSYGIGLVGPERIDEINILQATMEAMRIAISKLSIEPDVLLIDAVTIPDIEIKQIPIIGGDGKSISIAAASILAKVTRDRIMEEYDEKYPEYGFALHKGYGTASHIEAIKKYGPTPIHRRSFITHFI